MAQFVRSRRVEELRRDECHVLPEEAVDNPIEDEPHNEDFDEDEPHNEGFDEDKPLPENE